VSVSYCIFPISNIRASNVQASHIHPIRVLCAAFTRATGRWLLCLVALFGAVANVSAGINLRITLVTTGLPHSEAPFAGSNSTPAGQQAAAAKREAKSVAQAQLRAQVNSMVKVYAAKSDKELTALSAQWQELPRLDRQVLLREVKMRMARQRGRQGSVQIRTERRFGRLLRQADGSVVRVETRVVQVRPATEGEQAKQVRMRKSAYGTGFERRSAPSIPQAQPTQAQPAQAQPTQTQPAQTRTPQVQAPQRYPEP
jgi:hypothetical protein